MFSSVRCAFNVFDSSFCFFCTVPSPILPLNAAVASNSSWFFYLFCFIESAFHQLNSVCFTSIYVTLSAFCLFSSTAYTVLLLSFTPSFILSSTLWFFTYFLLFSLSFPPVFLFFPQAWHLHMKFFFPSSVFFFNFFFNMQERIMKCEARITHTQWEQC